jgi:hypothetical protein
MHNQDALFLIVFVVAMIFLLVAFVHTIIALVNYKKRGQFGLFLMLGLLFFVIACFLAPDAKELRFEQFTTTAKEVPPALFSNAKEVPSAPLSNADAVD